jgi:hypothetical protein
MGPLDLLYHVLNFVAPAFVVGILLAFCAPMFMKNKPLAQVRSAQVAINTIAGVSALMAGLLFFGRDGKMASYAAMVVASATSQWFALRR